MPAIVFILFKYRAYLKEKEEFPEPVKRMVLKMPHQRVSDIVVIAAISGIAGAKLLYVITDSDNIWEDLFSGAGLTIYGGLILAFIVVSWYIIKKKIN